MSITVRFSNRFVLRAHRNRAKKCNDVTAGRRRERNCENTIIILIRLLAYGDVTVVVRHT